MTVSDERLLAALRETRRELGSDIKQAFLDVGNEIVLPEARRRAPVKTGWLRANIAIGASKTKGWVYVPVRRRRDRGRIALIEFGGTRRDVIRPRTRKALTVGDGFAAVVTTARVYRAKPFMQPAVEGEQPRIRAMLADRITDAIQARVDQASVRT